MEWQSAGRELEQVLGRSVCVSSCGLCCRTNTVLALGVEADYAASWLVGLDTTAREALLDRIRNWLTEPTLYTVWPGQGEVIQRPLLGPQRDSPAVRRRLATELTVALRSPCPLLGEDMDCLVHSVRPLVCRAYGVTRLPGTYCRRPVGLGETPEYRAVWEGLGADALRSMVRDWFKVLEGNAGLYTTGVLPTMLYQRLRPAEYRRLVPNIPSAKLLSSNAYAAVLFQSQDDGRALMGRRIPLDKVRLEATV